MQYYKIILDSQIVGVCTSNNCFRFQQKHGILIKTIDDKAEYMECNNKLYRAGWMKPILTEKYSYTSAVILEITADEYNILVPASENTPIPIEEEEEEIIIPEQIDPADEITLNFIREAKINEMSSVCNRTIENGFNIETEDGIHHYSYALEDQLNLMNLSAAIARGEEQLSYHADGELCRFYTAAEINEIISAGNAWKTYHTTYFNALKSYINSLETIEEIGAITYGMELPEEFKTDVLRVIE